MRLHNFLFDVLFFPNHAEFVWITLLMQEPMYKRGYDEKKSNNG